MSQDELAITIAALVAWMLATAAIVFDCNLCAKLGQRWHAGHIPEVFKHGIGQELLVELALWWWVVFVRWTTWPNYG